MSLRNELKSIDAIRAEYRVDAIAQVPSDHLGAAFCLCSAGRAAAKSGP